MAFRRGDRVETSTGLTGKVTFTDPKRKLVAVEASEDGVGHDRGDEKVFKESEVRKA